MSDEELIFLFVEEKNDWAFTSLYEKYHNIIFSLTRKIFSKFFVLPLEFSDLQSIIYFNFYKSVVCFQKSKNKTFKNYLLINLNWELLKYFKKYITKNHQVLNVSLLNSECLVNMDSDYFQKQKFSFDIKDNLKLSFYERNILELKYYGFSNKEIMLKLDLNYKQVDNAFQRVVLKIKKTRII